jgi:hypothetical protein
LLALVRSDLVLGGRNDGVRMLAEKNATEPLARQEPRRSALDAQAFDFLAALALGNEALRARSATSSSSPVENSERPAIEIALESAPAFVPRSPPMRRRSSSMRRLGREAVPVRTTVAVMSARPGVVRATSALPLRKNNCAVIFGKV